MPSDRSTHSISFSDEVMRDVESFCNTHEIKKCEFFEIAARDLLGRENAVPERLQDASKSDTEEKLDRILEAVENGSGGGAGGRLSERKNRHNNNNGGDDGPDENVEEGEDDTSEAEEDVMDAPEVWEGLADGDRAELTWKELKDVSEYVREIGAWNELEIHPDRVGETKTRRKPVVAAAYGVIQWYHGDHNEQPLNWIEDENDDEEVTDVRGILRDVAPDDASEHALFERSGSRYPSYYDQLIEMLYPHPFKPRWVAHDAIIRERVEEIVEQDPSDFADWAMESEEGHIMAGCVVDEVFNVVDPSEMEVHGRDLPDDLPEQMKEYIPVRVAVSWLDVAVDEVGMDADEVLCQRAVYRQSCNTMGGHETVRSSVEDVIDPFVGEDGYAWV